MRYRDMRQSAMATRPARPGRAPRSCERRDTRCGCPGYPGSPTGLRRDDSEQGERAEVMAATVEAIRDVSTAGPA